MARVVLKKSRKFELNNKTKPSHQMHRGILDQTFRKGESVIVKIWTQTKNCFIVHYKEGTVIGITPAINYVVSINSVPHEVAPENLVKQTPVWKMTAFQV